MIVLRGNGKIDRFDDDESELIARQSFSVPEGATAYGYSFGQVWVDGVQIPAGYAFVASKAVHGLGHVSCIRYNYRGMGVLGVKVEDHGRVKYIDGCTDSLLVVPPRAGDPCLNSLHFPPNVDQSFHTHPSIRMGCVAEGYGWATVDGQDIELGRGDAWVIETGELHRFRTTFSRMVVIAYHPDSDWGPTDEVHPMLNKTILQ